MCASAALLAVPSPHLKATEITDRLDEVIVTARKREENLQQVPISIAAYDAEALTARSVTRLSDLGQVAPNFLYGQQTQSGSSAGELYVRGVGQHDTQSTFNPSVGIYVDGVYRARATANDVDLEDVERLEVLYGPQGTLFGKNTNGGAVNIVTKKPDLTAVDPTGLVELQGGNFHRFDARGSLNLPVVNDIAALTLSASRRSLAGYSRRIDGEDQANENRNSGSAQFLLRPVDGLEAILRVDDTRIEERSSAFKLALVRTASTIPMVYAASTPYRYDNRWVTASDFLSDGTGPNRNAGSVWGASLTLSWDQRWGSIKSITAYRRLDIESDFDPDGSPLAVLDVFNHVQQHQVSQELQATGTSWDKRIRWVTGLYYFRETAQDNQPANVGLEFFHGTANFNPELSVVNQNLAAYGQATVDLAPKIKLTAGARAGQDRAQVGRVQVNYPIPTVEQPFVSRSARWSSVLPRLSLEYQETPDLMMYVSASEGNKSGGFNGRAGSIAEFNGFDPEKVWTYEFGVRSDWFDRRLRLNATAFYSVYKDFQLLLNSSVTDPITGNPVPFSFVGNMPKASIKGGELALTALPLDGLKVSMGLGITDGRYIQVLPSAPVTTASQFVDAPRFTATAAIDYSLPFFRGQQFTPHVDYIHKSTIQYDYGNSPLVAQRPYGLLNARLNWQVNDGRFSVFLFGTNLTDVHYAIGGLDDGARGSLGEVIKEMGPPREWGIGGQFRF